MTKQLFGMNVYDIATRIADEGRVPLVPLVHVQAAEDAGRVAQAAGVKTLVPSHLVPAEDPGVTDQMWIDAARVHFRGDVIVGKDLLEI